MLETLGWKEEGRSRCAKLIFEYVWILNDYPWLNLIMVVLHVFHIWIYLVIFLQQPLYFDIFIHCPGQSICDKVALWPPRSKKTALEMVLHCEGLKLEVQESRIQYVMLCKQSQEDKEERVQQMYDDRQSKQTRTSILQDSSAFYVASFLTVAGSTYRSKFDSVQSIYGWNAVTNSRDNVALRSFFHLQSLGYMIQSLVWLLKYWLKSVAFATSISFDLSQLTFTSRTHGV